jgi:phosphoribosylformylglycinamidine (FGAM) synthase PurS component
MSTVYRFEIYPNIYNLNAQANQEDALKVWFHKYLNRSIKNIWEVRYFLVETETPIANIRTYAEEVFTDSVVEVLLTSVDENFEPLLNWLEKKNFKNPSLIDICYRPGVTDNSAHAALEALKLIPALVNVDMKVASGTMYFIESEKPMNSIQLEGLAYEKLANNLLHKVAITIPSEIAHFARMKTILFPSVSIKAEKAKLVDLEVSPK